MTVAGFATDRLWLQRVRSWELALLIVGLHAAGVVSVWFTAFPLPLRWALMGGVTVHGIHMLAEQALLWGPRAVVRLNEEAGRWRVTFADGGTEAAEWVRPAWVPGPFALLSFRSARGVSDLLLLPQSVLHDEFRRLRVHANLGYLNAAEPAGD